MNLDELMSLKEGNRLEMKAAQGRDGAGAVPRSVWETLSAFANTSGGLILLGVEEPRPGEFEVVGLGNPDKVLDDFWNAALSKDKVSARFLRDEDATVEEVDGKSIVAIRVPWVDRHSRPVFINDDLFGGTFRRTHTGDHLCGREEVLSMLRDADTSSQDASVAREAEIGFLNRETVARYRMRFDQRNENHVWSGLPDEAFLTNIGALRRDDDGKLRPTRAGLLMFGEDRWITYEFPHYFLDYRQETGSDTRWDDRFTSQPGDWSGNVYDFYFRVYNKLKAALKVPFQLDGIDRVDDTPAHEALREAIANCLTNSNWFERRGVVCVWENDAITIANPGDFRMPISEAMKPGSSDPRNEAMMKMFAMVDIGERAGSGIDKIFKGWSWAGYGMPSYEVAFGPDRTTLTLPLTPAGEGESTDSTGQERPKAAESGRNGLEGAKAKIVEVLAASAEPLSSAAIATSIGLGKTRTNELIGELIASGHVVAEGATRSRRYRLA